jgi:RNA polymerase sigma-70 factor (ECF subfamily)
MEAVQTIHGASAHEPAQGIPQRDDERFDALFSRYSPALYRIAFRKLGNTEDVEDAVQDALLSAFRNMHQFRGDAQFSTWLGSIVLNAARMQLRRRIRHTLVSLDEQSKEGVPIWTERLEDCAPDAEETLRETQMRENLERVVENLPVRLRVAFRLRVFEGLTTSEAATALGVPKGTLKARFFRAGVKVKLLSCVKRSVRADPQRMDKTKSLVHMVRRARDYQS